MRASAAASRPSVLALNPRNREASAARRSKLLTAFNNLDEDARADLLEAAESMAWRLTPGLGLDTERDEARTILGRMYYLAGWSATARWRS
jgi:hypothetical protein